MINVSTDYRKAMLKSRKFKRRAVFTLADGTVLELGDHDFTVRNNTLVDSADANGIPLGAAICRSVQLEIQNFNDEYSKYDFYGARLHVYCVFENDSIVDEFTEGLFTVLQPETEGTTITITALDDMYKADIDYKPLWFHTPCTLYQLLQNVCDFAGILLATSSFYNSDFVIEGDINNKTCREMIGLIAMLAVGNARISRTGQLEIISYTNDYFDFAPEKDGGSFKYTDGANLDGGSFSFTDGDNEDCGDFEYRDINYHILDSWKNLRVETDDVVITGVRMGSAFMGYQGYILELTNPLAEKHYNDAVFDHLAPILVGARFRPFTGDSVAYPLAEFMDRVLIVDRKGNTYKSFLTNINFVYNGFTTFSNSAEPALRNALKPISNYTKVLQDTKAIVEEERTMRQLAEQRLQNEINDKSGLYQTVDVGDSGFIYYMHDKEELEESTVIWKLTANAFAISNNGGQSYDFGLDKMGMAIVNSLFANDAVLKRALIDDLEALRIKAGSVDAENITGDTIKGKTMEGGKITGVEVNADGIELYGNKSISEPYIDFHYNRSSADYTGRIWQTSATGNLIAIPAISSTSDRRLKEDIKDLDDKYLTLFDSINPKSFRLKKYPSLRLGFIAQDVDEALDNAGFEEKPLIEPMKGDDGNDYLGITYDDMIAVLWKKVQSLQEQINALKEAKHGD
ncbi:MAG: tail fiber domain-containing protein [Prevotella sp.]|nr:tail fiber domain-containing protein [Candidatus Prevotella equi]